jgi:hypothetical protein
MPIMTSHLINIEPLDTFVFNYFLASIPLFHVLLSAKPG